MKKAFVTDVEFRRHALVIWTGEQLQDVFLVSVTYSECHDTGSNASFPICRHNLWAFPPSCWSSVLKVGKPILDSLLIQVFCCALLVLPSACLVLKGASPF
jgi:hypothetical protein